MNLNFDKKKIIKKMYGPHKNDEKLFAKSKGKCKKKNYELSSIEVLRILNHRFSQE
jgi:hypothetical protein